MTGARRSRRADEDDAVRAVKRRLLTIHSADPVDAAEELVDALHSLGQAEVTLYHRPLVTSGGGRVSGGVLRAPPDLDSAYDRFEAAYANVAPGMKQVSSAWDVSKLKPMEARSFVEFHRLVPDEELHRRAFYKEVIGPLGIGDQQRLLVVHDGKMLAWIGFLRRRSSGRFGASDRQRMAPLVDRVRDVCVAIGRLSEDFTPDDPADFVLDSEGRIEHASATALQWLRAPGFDGALRAHVRHLEGRRSGVSIDAIAPHADARSVRLDAMGAVRYLVSVRKARWHRLSPINTLPPSLRRVAIRVARGMTDKEVAADLEMPLTTVRTYVRRIFRRLGVDHRAKLAAMMTDGIRR